jgi:Anthrone oxygenase
MLRTITLHPIPTMNIAYDIATATVTGLMTGNEFAVAAFVHPQLHKLAQPTHAQTAAPLASVLGKAMPIWYSVALVLILGAAFEHRPVSSGPGLFILLAAVLWAATIVFTITMLVPINTRIAKMNPEHPYDCWLQDRCRWDHLHQTRVALLIMAFILLLTGLFAGA